MLIASITYIRVIRRTRGRLPAAPFDPTTEFLLVLLVQMNLISFREAKNEDIEKKDRRDAQNAKKEKDSDEEGVKLK
jgi:hypothetical protein